MDLNNSLKVRFCYDSSCCDFLISYLVSLVQAGSSLRREPRESFHRSSSRCLHRKCLFYPSSFLQRGNKMILEKNKLLPLCQVMLTTYEGGDRLHTFKFCRNVFILYIPHINGQTWAKWISTFESTVRTLWRVLSRLDQG